MGRLPGRRKACLLLRGLGAAQRPEPPRNAPRLPVSPPRSARRVHAERVPPLLHVATAATAAASWLPRVATAAGAAGGWPAAGGWWPAAGGWSPAAGCWLPPLHARPKALLGALSRLAPGLGGAAFGVDPHALGPWQIEKPNAGSCLEIPTSPPFRPPPLPPPTPHPNFERRVNSRVV